MTTRNYCSKCGRKLINQDGTRFCPVHITDMNPVTRENPMVKKFKSYPKRGG